VLGQQTDATAADTPALYIARTAEVRKLGLIFPVGSDLAMAAALAELDIEVR